MLRTVASRAGKLASTGSRYLTTIREPGVVGLSAGDNPREILTQLYQKTLDAVKDLPQNAAYKTNVEKITNYRMEVINENDDIEKIEAILNIGQIQEVIEQAENELELIPHMAEWKPWEMKDGQKPVSIEVLD